MVTAIGFVGVLVSPVILGGVKYVEPEAQVKIDNFSMEGLQVVL